MSNVNDPGPTDQPEKVEVENLSSDDLDVQELDDQLLEEAAGGLTYSARCTSNCNNNVC